MVTNITTIILGILTVIGGVATYFIIPLLQEKLTLAQREKIFKAVEIACKCADQLVNTGVLDKVARHEHVINYLNTLGYTYDVDEVNEMIEAIVLTLPPLLISDKIETSTTNTIPAVSATDVTTSKTTKKKTTTKKTTETT